MLDGNFAYTYARFKDTGNPIGSFIPEAPAVVASAGITLGEDLGWFGALRWRYFGVRPLIEDGSVYDPARPRCSMRAWATHSRTDMKLNLDVLNLLNAQADQITYYYLSRLPGEPLAGVNDVHVHPVEPLAVRFTVSKAF